MDIALFAAVLLAIGAFAGILAGLLGVGGGIVLVPAFFYAFRSLGFDGPDLMQVCVATSLATIVVTSIRSVLSHRRKGSVDMEVLRSWAPGIVVGALVGTWLATQLDTRGLQMIFACLAMIVALYLAFGAGGLKFGDQMPRGATRAGVSAVIGCLSTLMGIGGGSLGVPTMSLYGMPIHRAVGTAAGFGLAIAVPSTLGFLLARVDGAPPLTVGSVNLPAFGLIIAMTLVTTPWGVELAHRMDPTPLKRVFAGFLFLVAVNMGLEALGVL